ncbi:MAG: hypothetical protein KDC80_04110 [Saprospiraceae bacterium]|nr:hypothetical protein [Saprospiraceae bacterium]
MSRIKTINRRDFNHLLRTSFAFPLIAGSLHFPVNEYGTSENELKNHKIDHWEIKELNYHWPRPVGKNGRRDVHGQFHKFTAIQLFTDQGASGWGLTSAGASSSAEQLKGKLVSEVFSETTGILDRSLRDFDFALHDLAGKILDKPVYEMLGSQGAEWTPIYSGMIYLDELEPPENPAGVDGILENCLWDYEYGFRQLKVKIGRSGKWYPHDQGLAKDIEVVRTIFNAMGDSIEILVDANDVYSLSDTIAFMEGIGDIPIFWIEEPFHENREESVKLKKWLLQNNRSTTLYVDGEANPDHELCMELGKEKILDAYLADIHSFGFTAWRKLMPKLIKDGIQASPHAWGNLLKTYYIAHLARGLGNIVTIEGVVCYSDEVNFGNYQISDGKITPSFAPGFGMEIL